MSNKEVVSLEGVVKSDSSVEQRVYFVRGLRRPLKGGSIMYFVRHEFISKKYISIGMRYFGEAQSKATRTSHKNLCSKWTISYHCGDP